MHLGRTRKRKHTSRSPNGGEGHEQDRQQASTNSGVLDERRAPNAGGPVRDRDRDGDRVIPGSQGVVKRVARAAIELLDELVAASSRPPK